MDPEVDELLSELRIAQELRIPVTELDQVAPKWREIAYISIVSKQLIREASSR